MSSTEEKILARALNRQPETAEIEELDALQTRLRGYLEGEPWSEDDVRLVWTSPGARRRLLAARAALAREAEARWDALGFDREFRMQAASGEETRLILGETGIVIEIVRAPASGDWLISASLTPDALALVPHDLSVKLVDSGGMQWLSGRPDRYGGIDTIWEGDGISPIERLQTHSLTLKLG